MIQVECKGLNAARAAIARVSSRLGRFLCIGLCAVGMASWTPAVAQGWMVTLLEGDASVVNDSRQLVAVPGLVLPPGALLETGSQTGVLRLEGRGQSKLDLGPSTRVMLAPGPLPGTRDRAPVLYLLQGWVKATSGPDQAGAVPGLATAALDVLPLAGSVVIQVHGANHRLFAEGGTLQLNERRRGGQLHSLRGGQFFTTDVGRSGVVEPRPPADWLVTVPRTFRDSLPMRAEALRGQAVKPTTLPGPTHAQLAPWLEAELYVRRDFPKRFAALARDPDFRQNLRSRLRAHPEWGPVLDPPPPQVLPKGQSPIINPVPVEPRIAQ